MTNGKGWSARWLAFAGVLALVAAACGDDGTSSPAQVEVVDSIGTTEDALNLIAWVGYVEDGTTEGYENYDWVTPFEDQTGCDVTVKYADSSDEMYNLMTSQAGQWDGVSASGDSSNRLIASGAVEAVDTALFPDFADVIAPLQPDGGSDNQHYVVDGNVYGTPYMYGPNFLMYNSEVVTPAPTSWDVVFESTLNGAANPYAGKITAYDFPIYIADAAIYLMTHNPDLGITDPYALTEDQLNAATDLLKQQSGMIDKYWAAYTTEIDGFANGSMVAGTAWPINLSLVEVDRPRGDAGRAHGGHERLGRHVDVVHQRSPSELHARVDEVRPDAGCAGRGGRVLRCRGEQHGGVPDPPGFAGDTVPVRRRGRHGPLRVLRGCGVLGLPLPLADAADAHRLLRVDAEVDGDPRSVNAIRWGRAEPGPTSPSSR